jgi:hypothetical protein
MAQLLKAAQVVGANFMYAHRVDPLNRLSLFKTYELKGYYPT